MYGRSTCIACTNVYCRDIWHLDGYNKLSLFGIDIHGCIDGYMQNYMKFYMPCMRDCSYSRKILWLEIADSTSNPKYIAHRCVKQLGGIVK